MNCERCEYLGHMKDQYGWAFKTCSCPPYKGKFVGEIKECPIGKEIF